MYAIYGNICHQYTPNVSIYTIHDHTWILWDMWCHPPDQENPKRFVFFHPGWSPGLSHRWLRIVLALPRSSPLAEMPQIAAGLDHLYHLDHLYVSHIVWLTFFDSFVTSKKKIQCPLVIQHIETPPFSKASHLWVRQHEADEVAGPGAMQRWCIRNSDNKMYHV